MFISTFSQLAIFVKTLVPKRYPQTVLAPGSFFPESDVVIPRVIPQVYGFEFPLLFGNKSSTPKYGNLYGNRLLMVIHMVI